MLINLINGILIYFLIITPYIISVLFDTTSLTAGVVLSSVLTIFFIKISKNYKSHFYTILYIVILIFIQLILLLLIGVEINYARLFQSVLVLIIVFTTACYFIGSVKTISDNKIYSILNITFYLIAITPLVSYFFNPLISLGYNKPVLIFSEPSQFALIFIPFLLFKILNTNSHLYRNFMIVYGLIVGLYLENLTIFIGIFLVCIITMRLRELSIMLIAAIFAISLSNYDFSYYISRIDFLDDVTNVSTLVYFSGWERAFLQFKNSYGLGVGFQQFGLFGDQLAEMQTALAAYGLDDLNLLDGGTVGAKFIGEFGIFGIFFILAFLYLFFKKFIYLRKIKLNEVKVSELKVFYTSVFCLFIIQIFIRGSGYFAISSAIFIQAIIALLVIKI